MGALEAAYDDRLLDKQREFTALSQLLFMFENPRKAARVIEDGLNQGIVKKEEKTLKAVLNIGTLQKNIEGLNLIINKPQQNLKKENFLYSSGKYTLVWMNLIRQRKLFRMVKKGKLKDEAAAYMLLGQINFENQKWKQLLSLLESALT